jgi:hypothetical protein
VWDGLDEEQRDGLLIKLDWMPGRKTFAALGELLAQYQPTFLSLADWRKREQELTTPEAL